MGINLSKGERINLSKEAPSLKKVGVGLGWDTNSTDTGVDFDLDASVFMLGANGKIPSEKSFIFYNNLTSPDGAVKHTGDNLTGEGDGDDETILVELAKVDSGINELVFVVTVHEAEKRRQNFGQVRNAFIRLYDQDTNKEVAKYELDEDFSKETAIEFGKLYKKDGQWRFQAVGQGYNSGLQGFVDKYFEG
ncbi:MULTISPECIES: TerD family protein [Pelosinus]|jgi:tellurium resistance protein TerD|uniref:Stress protein n=1 Tax=Pelosinus fermentans B4 TaxID=1149862 RepID=I8RAG2_9FIRM|nr:MULTISPECIES: TerD family protein [Pelosinus]EIW15878.1 stress protein [Pelosinus fermentans B4]EIW27416.1 stress protein [Pelosinus fermentans A11]OAM92627.1 stress protein [Pelosinus fermentans DSM 17108]SDQ51423.1 tellurium resistance protein TerD [Pelosinus fermentans]